MMQESFFYKLFKQNTFVLLGGRVWEAGNKIEHDCHHFRWYDKVFGLTKGVMLKSLEEDYLEKYSNTIRKAGEGNAEEVRLAEFVLNSVIRKRRKEIKRNNGSKIEAALTKKDAFVCEGTLFDLCTGKTQNHEIWIEKKAFCIGNKFLETEELEARYKRILEETWFGRREGNEVARLLQKGCFYDAHKNIGFEKTDKGFFIYALIEPYYLHERKNDKYYRFGEAKVGLQLEVVDNNVAWHDGVVINNYMHPALPAKDAYQKICTGNFSYDRIRERYEDIGDQVRVALQKARTTIENGYFSRGGSWNELIETKYKEMEVENPRGGRVTNA